MLIPILNLFESFCKTLVTHGRMYCRIAAGYQIWKIVSNLRIIFFICEHVRTIHNIVVASSITDMLCPWECHGKIKLLEFSVKGLRILGVINIRINPYVIHKASLTSLQHPYMSLTHPCQLRLRKFIWISTEGVRRQ